MSVKILKIALIILGILTLTSCSSKQIEPRIQYVDKPIYVNVPVKCVVPDANCSFNKKTDTEVITSLLECIIDMKHNEKICKGQ